MKRIFSFLLSVIFVFTVTLSASAAGNRKDIIDHISKEAFSNYEKNAAIRPERTLEVDEIIIPLIPKGFRDENDAIIDWDGAYDLGPSVAQLRDNDVRANILIAKGNRLIRDIEIVKYTPTPRVRARSAIRIRFVEELISTKEVEYRFRVCIVHDGKNTFVDEVFGGMISNPIIDVNSNNDYVDLGKGVVARSKGSINNIEVDLGSGVSAYINMAAGEKYFGLAKHEDNNKQSAILAAYPQIEGVYSIQTINIQPSLNYVSIKIPMDEEDSQYYVYDQFGTYLGRSGDRLPYATRYYLSTESIVIEVDEKQYIDGIVDEKPLSEALERFISQGAL